MFYDQLRGQIRDKLEISRCMLYLSIQSEMKVEKCELFCEFVSFTYCGINVKGAYEI